MLRKPVKMNWRRVLPIASLVAVVIAADQLSKYLIRAHLGLGQAVPHGWPVQITNIENSGSAFGLFGDQTGFLIVASVIAIGIMLYFYRQVAGGHALLRISLGLQLGGALSNLADRIRFGHVTDFIDFKKWPVFNVADSCITVGIVILVLTVLLQGERKTGSSSAAGVPPTSAS